MPNSQPTNSRSKPVCTVCKSGFYTKEQLESHVVSLGHFPNLPEEPQSGLAYTTMNLRVGARTGHGRIRPVDDLVCDECSRQFGSMTPLQMHAATTLHSPYICVCGKKFSRLADLERHWEQYPETRISPRFPCTYCKNHRGDKAFGRKDHLTQHIRNYHHIGVDDQYSSTLYYLLVCPHIGCPEYRDAHWRTVATRNTTMPFTTRAAYMKHMRQVHNESPFPCGVPGCPRIAGKGYFRKTDMLRHRKKEHPEAPPLNAGDVHAVIESLDCLSYQ